MDEVEGCRYAGKAEGLSGGAAADATFVFPVVGSGEGFRLEGEGI